MTRFQVLMRSSLLALMVGASFSAAADLASVVQEAERLIASEQPNAALEVLQPAAQEYAGNPVLTTCSRWL